MFIGKTVFRADLVSNNSPNRGMNLSKRGPLGKGEALLIEFDSDRNWTTTMKGIRFPIDIIWLDKDRVVVHIERNVQPDAEPYREYLPKSAARYIMKVSSGQTEGRGISPGVKARFEKGGIGI